jgi:acetylornithine deacetylase/succinyl-diaminopimelate desuccinylase-like protein
MIDKVIAYIDENKNKSVERLCEFLKIPSISTESERKGDTRKAGEWVRDLLTGCGIKAELVDTPGHPCVIGDTGPVNGGPTILVYGHFDVQPPGDMSLWKSDPFVPTIRDGRIFARGSADDKGQVLTHMLAAEAWMKIAKKVPIRVKFLIEGEEEVSSPNLAPVIKKHRDRLACDYIVLSDTAKWDENTPGITYGTKGLVYKEIIVTGPKQNLHSGSYGGTLTNPGNALATIIAALRDKDHRITIPGFYDDVRPLSDKERKMMAEIDFDEKAYQAYMGCSALTGEKGFTTLERRWARPTLDVNGLHGGFTAEGAMTIIPAKMMAKVSMRLVPDQDADKISKAFEQAVLAAAPEGVKVEFKSHGATPAYVAPLDSPGVKAAAKASELGWGKAPMFMREGGTLPILPMFKQVLGADSIMMGFAAQDCNLHGPNEFFGVDDLHKGAKASAYLLHELAQK